MLYLVLFARIAFSRTANSRTAVESGEPSTTCRSSSGRSAATAW